MGTPAHRVTWRSTWRQVERHHALTSTEKELVRLVADPGFPAWLAQVRSTGGCERPVWLAGHATSVDASTGEVLRDIDTRGLPGERLAVRCRNRRASQCESCSRQHSGDTFHLVAAGLAGGKGLPASVAGHPRLFVTLTAPSFGAVHRATAGSGRCRPRRAGGECEHGRPLSCDRRHAPGARLVGEPLCADCYDYAGHVLWHAHAGELWARTVRGIRRRLASSAGIARSRLGEHVVVSFAKVAEYQSRGAVHVHAVVRLDGPGGPGESPPGWASEVVLAEAVRGAVSAASVTTPYASALGEYVIRWGSQLDVHPIGAEPYATPVTNTKVAAYVAKYVTKSATDSGGADRRIRSAADLHARRVPAHIRSLMAVAWRLGALPELAHLKLRNWAHTLGFRGHVLTKSRAYSTTYKGLREERAAWRGGVQLGTDAVVVDAAWRFVGAGWDSKVEAELARGVGASTGSLGAAWGATARGSGGWVGSGGSP